jgi:NAD(P)-dependent dehydrogenase (short-subunit alcohol dehydrogenase family)
LCWGQVPAAQAGATEKPLPFYSRAKEQKYSRVDLRHRAAEETTEIIAAEGGDATSFTADVSKAQDIKSLVDACIKAYSRIDILLNNVGILAVGGREEMTEEVWDHQLAVHASSLRIGHDVEHHRMQRSGIPYFRCEPGSSVSLSVNDPPIRSERRELAPLSTRITATGVVGFPIR